MSLESGQILNNRFRVAAQLEKDSYGSIFRAWDLQGDCPCMVKEIFKGIPGGIDRYVNLAQRLVLLDNPNLQKILAYSLIPGQGMYLVFEHLEGKTLDEVQEERNGVIDEKEAVRWAAQIAGALDALHSLNPPLIHGNVSLKSITINKQGNAVLGDFSCIMVQQNPLPIGLKLACDSPGFSAPEWHTEKAVDVRSDVYSLGAVLYSMLTGIIPQQSAEKMTHDAWQAVDSVNPSTSPGVARVIEHAVSLDPDRRFFNVKAFQNALLAGAGLPLESIPGVPRQIHAVVRQDSGSLKAELAKSKKKWLGWVIAGAVVSLAAIAGLILFVFGIGEDFPGILGLHPTETAQKKVEKTRKVDKDEDRESEEAAEATEEMPATEEPVVVITEEPATEIQLEIWHSYSGTAAEALTEILAAFGESHPYISIMPTYFEATNMYSMFDTAMAAGDGPAMIITAGVDRSFELLDEGYLKDVSGLISPSLFSGMNEQVVDTVKQNNILIGVPIFQNGVLLYRNSSIIPESPQNWDDLIAKASAATTGDTTGMIFETGLFFSAGHLYALGGQLLDQDSGVPLFLDDYGVAWLNEMKKGKDAGLPMSNYIDGDTNEFKSGKVGMIIDGSWSAASLSEAIGVENLVIDSWPEGMSGFVLSDVVSLVNNGRNNKNEEAASIAFMEFLVSEQAQMIWADVACSNHELGSGVPILKDLYVADPLVEMAMHAFSGGVSFPYNPQMVFYWSPLNNAITNVLEYSMDPWDALQSAHDEILSQLP